MNDGLAPCGEKRRNSEILEILRSMGKYSPWAAVANELVQIR